MEFKFRVGNNMNVVFMGDGTGKVRIMTEVCRFVIVGEREVPCDQVQVEVKMTKAEYLLRTGAQIRLLQKAELQRLSISVEHGHQATALQKEFKNAKIEA